MCIFAIWRSSTILWSNENFKIPIFFWATVYTGIEGPVFIERPKCGQVGETLYLLHTLIHDRLRTIETGTGRAATLPAYLVFDPLSCQFVDANHLRRLQWDVSEYFHFEKEDLIQISFKSA
jgi:hypothetical protein